VYRPLSRSTGGMNENYVFIDADFDGLRKTPVPE
jgi:hypothetical protein